jgi:hypothetical protein
MNPTNAKCRRTIFGKYEVTYDCPECGASLKNDLDDAGKRDTCPHCECEFKVPGSSFREKIEKEKAEKLELKLEQDRLKESEKQKKDAISLEIKVAEKDNTEKAKQEAASYNNIIVTTGDLRADYDIIGPVFFQVSNRGGFFSSPLDKIAANYKAEISQMRSSGQFSPRVGWDWGFFYGEYNVGQNDFDKAFFVGVQELKKRAMRIGANAVICMRQDFDLDTDGRQHFYLQMYGTAVKMK